MNEIPTTCYRCGKPLGYKADSPNKLTENHIVKWVCKDCFRKEGDSKD